MSHRTEHVNVILKGVSLTLFLRLQTLMCHLTSCLTPSIIHGILFCAMDHCLILTDCSVLNQFIRFAIMIVVHLYNCMVMEIERMCIPKLP